MNNTRYTQEEINQMIQMKEQGASYKEIAEMFGRSYKAIEQKFFELRKFGNASAPADKGPKLVKIPKLEDFSPREMIRHLYKLGYRIEDNRLVLVKKEYVNMKSIMED